MKSFKFRKLFYNMKEEYYGIAEEAVITFAKEAILFKSVDMGNCIGRTVPAQYKYHLRIDLWLVIFEFHWKGKEMKTKEEF